MSSSHSSPPHSIFLTSSSPSLPVSSFPSLLPPFLSYHHLLSFSASTFCSSHAPLYLLSLLPAAVLLFTLSVLQSVASSQAARTASVRSSSLCTVMTFSVAEVKLHRLHRQKKKKNSLLQLSLSPALTFIIIIIMRSRTFVMNKRAPTGRRPASSDRSV